MTPAAERRELVGPEPESTAAVIFGASIVGEVLLKALEESGVRVACFCDNNRNKGQQPFCGLPVVLPDALPARYPGARVVIAAADIEDVVRQLAGLGVSTWESCAPLLRGFDVHRHEYSTPTDFADYAVTTCLRCHDSYLSPDKIFLRSVDVIITERCSLKCRDCANLMQYYRHPRDCDSAETLAAADLLCDLVDEVNEFRVIGGEPFMNREFHTITQRLIAQPKVRHVVIYTNGTIVPAESQLRAIRDKKVLVLITEYEGLSKGAPRLEEALDRVGIAYYARRAGGWTECASVRKHDRDEADAQAVFAACCAKNTFTLSDGSLYRCPFSANADRLRALPDFPGDRVDLARPDSAPDAGRLRSALRAFRDRRSPLGACDYCNGRPFGGKEIVPAVQTRTPLEYNEYGRALSRFAKAE